MEIMLLPCSYLQIFLSLVAENHGPPIRETSVTRGVSGAHELCSSPTDSLTSTPEPNQRPQSDRIDGKIQNFTDIGWD